MTAALAGHFRTVTRVPGSFGMKRPLGLPGAVPLAGRIEETFRQRIEALPAGTRRLLQLAAADPSGDPSLAARLVEEDHLIAEATSNPAGYPAMVLAAWQGRERRRLS